MIKCFDVGIIGAGISGAFSALRAAEEFKDSSIILFDLGRPPGKRRRQLEGWLGCFPTGDGKIHSNDVLQVSNIVKNDNINVYETFVNSKLSECGSMKLIIDKLPQVNVKKRAESLGFQIIKNNYIQWKPEYVHKLSKNISDIIIKSGNVELSFDNEVYSINKVNGIFKISTEKGNFECKNVLISVGRSGWRWASDLYNQFGISKNDDYAYFGIRIEYAAQYMKEFNKSHCSFIRDDLEIGPLSWDGAVIPEDHADLVVSAFRSNEERWRKMGKDKVSFNLIGKRYVKGKGIKEMERLAKLAFLMFNDRVGREKTKYIINKNGLLCDLPEYNWMIDVIKELEYLFPAIITRGYYHSPTIKVQTCPININKDLQTDIEGMYVAGESANLFGINAAAISGTIAIDNILK
jgi:thioredoxin reductase